MTITTTDLMYASFLLAIGGNITTKENCGRYTKLTIEMPNYALEQAKDKTGRLDRLAKRSESSQELQFIFSQSLLGDISTKYFKLKRSLARERSK
tara:strand:+ start:7433 stop:7717 length:285 start_codon:yes stop_codon:yes gene_type:complete